MGLCEVPLETDGSPTAFLEAATRFCNEKVWGTLCKFPSALQDPGPAGTHLVLRGQQRIWKFYGTFSFVSVVENSNKEAIRETAIMVPWGPMGPLGPMGPWGPMGPYGTMGP